MHNPLLSELKDLEHCNIDLAHNIVILIWPINQTWPNTAVSVPGTRRGTTMKSVEGDPRADGLGSSGWGPSPLRKSATGDEERPHGARFLCPLPRVGFVRKEALWTSATRLHDTAVVRTRYINKT